MKKQTGWIVILMQESGSEVRTCYKTHQKDQMLLCIGFYADDGYTFRVEPDFF